MKTLFHRVVSATLIGTLLANPSMATATSITYSWQTHTIQTLPLARLQEDALALDPLSVGRFQFKPLVTLWDMLKDYSGLGRLGKLWNGSWILVTPEGLPFAMGPLLFSSHDEENSSAGSGRSSSKKEDAELMKQFLELTQMAGIEADPHTTEAVPLLNSLPQPKRERHNGHHKIIEIVQRVNETFKLPYDPPDSVYDEHSPLVERRNELNQIELIGSSVNSLDELLLVMAKKLIRLRDPSIESDTRHYLQRELEELYAPLAYSLGMRTVSYLLWKQAFRFGNPTEYENTVSDRKRILGMDEEEAHQYQKDLVSKIKGALEEAGIHAKVFGDPKDFQSIYRKLHVKSKEYPTIDTIGDLLRATIVLENKKQLNEAAGIVSKFFDSVVPGKQTELKRLATYNAFHTTLIRKVKDAPQRHEVQFFESEADYHLYKYGFPDAHWAYIQRLVTHQLMDFAVFDVDEKDPRGNFARFKDVIHPWTYFFSSRLIGKNRFLITRRIPRIVDPKGHTTRGNIADFLAISGQAVNSPVYAYTYKTSFNTDLLGDQRWENGIESAASLSTILENGTVMRLTPGKATVSPDIMETVASLKTAIELSDILERGKKQKKEKRPKINGESILKQRFEKLLNTQNGKKFYRVSINQAYKNSSVLSTLAANLGYTGPDQLLDILALQKLPAALAEAQSQLLGEVIEATAKRGMDLLEVNHNIDSISASAWAAAATNYGLLDKERLLVAVGLRLIDAGAVHTFWKNSMPQKPSLPLSPKTNTSSNNLSLQVEYKEEPEAYRIQVNTNHNQPGILAAIAEEIVEWGPRLNMTASAQLYDQGAVMVFVIKKNDDLHSPGQLAALLDHIQNTNIPRAKPLAADKLTRLSVRLLLDEKAHAFQAVTYLLAGLNANIENLEREGQTGSSSDWYDLEITIPKLHTKHFEQSPSLILQEKLAEFTAENGQLIDFEVTEKDISEATASDLLSILQSENEKLGIGKRKWLGLFDRSVQKIRSSRDDISKDPIDEDFIYDFVMALAMAKELHQGQERRSHRISYLVHPLAVVRILIEDYGVRNRVQILAALLHDGPEDGPLNRLRIKLSASEFKALGHEALDQKIAQEREVIIEEIKYKLPVYGDRIIHAIDKDTVVKLADRQNNLEDIFNVGASWAVPFGTIPTYKYQFAQKQLSKTIRDLLIRIMNPIGANSLVFRNSRRNFLRIFVLRIIDKRLSNLLFVESYVGILERTPLSQTLHSFLRWLKENPDLLPAKFDDKIRPFRSRLQELADRLSLSAAMVSREIRNEHARLADRSA